MFRARCSGCYVGSACRGRIVVKLGSGALRWGWMQSMGPSFSNHISKNHWLLLQTSSMGMIMIYYDTHFFQENIHQFSIFTGAVLGSAEHLNRYGSPWGECCRVARIPATLLRRLKGRSQVVVQPR